MNSDQSNSSQGDVAKKSPKIPKISSASTSKKSSSILHEPALIPQDSFNGSEDDLMITLNSDKSSIKTNGSLNKSKNEASTASTTSSLKLQDDKKSENANEKKYEIVNFPIGEDNLNLKNIKSRSTSQAELNVSNNSNPSTIDHKSLVSLLQNQLSNTSTHEIGKGLNRSNPESRASTNPLEHTTEIKEPPSTLDDSKDSQQQQIYEKLFNSEESAATKASAAPTSRPSSSKGSTPRKIGSKTSSRVTSPRQSKLKLTSSPPPERELELEKEPNQEKQVQISTHVESTPIKKYPEEEEQEKEIMPAISRPSEEIETYHNSMNQVSDNNENNQNEKEHQNKQDDSEANSLNSKPLKGILKKTDYIPLPLPPLSVQSSRSEFSDQYSVMSKESVDLLVYSHPQKHSRGTSKQSKNEDGQQSERDERDSEKEIHGHGNEEYDDDDDLVIMKNTTLSKVSKNYSLPSSSKKIQLNDNPETQFDDDNVDERSPYAIASEEGEDFDTFYESQYGAQSMYSSRPVTRQSQKEKDPLDIGFGWNPSVKIQRYDEYKVDSVFRGDEFDLACKYGSPSSTPSKPNSAKPRVFSRLPRLSQPKYRIEMKLRPESSNKQISPFPFRAPGIAKPPSRKAPYRGKFSIREPNNFDTDSHGKRTGPNTPNNGRRLSTSQNEKSERFVYKSSSNNSSRASSASSDASHRAIKSSTRRRVSLIPVLTSKNKIKVASRYMSTVKKDNFPVVKIIPRVSHVKTELEEEEQLTQQQPKKYSSPYSRQTQIKRPTTAVKVLPPINTNFSASITEQPLPIPYSNSKSKSPSLAQYHRLPDTLNYPTLTETPLVSQKTKITGGVSLYKNMDIIYGRFAPILPGGYAEPIVPSQSSTESQYQTASPHSMSKRGARLSNAQGYLPSSPSTYTNPFFPIQNPAAGYPSPTSPSNFASPYMPFYMPASPFMMYAAPPVLPQTQQDYISRKFSKVPSIPTHGHSVTGGLSVSPPSSNPHAHEPYLNGLNSQQQLAMMNGFPIVPNPFMYGWGPTMPLPPINSQQRQQSIISQLQTPQPEQAENPT